MPKQWSKSQKFWQWLWPYFCMVVGFGGAVILIYLDLAYKHGHIAVDYGGYISAVIAVCILFVLLVLYIKKVIYAFELNRKQKNRN
jgi:hypothetical protein